VLIQNHFARRILSADTTSSFRNSLAPRRPSGFPIALSM